MKPLREEPPGFVERLGLLENAAKYPGRHDVADAVWKGTNGNDEPAVLKRARITARDTLRTPRGERAYLTATRLRSLGLPTPEPLGWALFPNESWYACRKVDGAAQVREWFLHRMDADRFPAPRHDIPFATILASLGRLARSLHQAGVYFRDFTDGNVLVTPNGDLTLVDLDRARFLPVPLSLDLRLRDLSRPGVTRPDDQAALLEAYFAPEPVPPAALQALLRRRARLVFWDDLKLALRPWRRRE